MKKNGILLAILIGLLGFTYVFQEVGERKEKEELKHNNGLFDARELGTLLEFSTIDSTVIISNESYQIKETKLTVDPRKVQVFFNALSGIRIKRVLTPEEVAEKNISTFFTTEGSRLEKMSFLFPKHNLHFYLGRKLEFDQSFYMKVEKDGEITYVIAYDEAAMNVPVAKKEFHRNDLKYRRFQSLFYFNDDYFLDYRLFHPWMKSDWSIKTVEISNSRNPKHSIYFTKGQTNPTTPSFLKVDLGALKEFEKRLVNLTALKRVGRISGKRKKLGTMKVTTVDEKACILTFYKKNSDYLVHSSLLNETFSLKEEEKEIFLSHVQLYWNMTLLHQDTEVLVEFGQNRRYKLKASLLLETLKTEAKYMMLFEKNKIKTMLVLIKAGQRFLVQKDNENLHVIHEKTLQTLVYPLNDATLISLNEESYK